MVFDNLEFRCKVANKANNKGIRLSVFMMTFNAFECITLFHVLFFPGCHCC